MHYNFRAKISLLVALNVLLYANVAGFAYFGRDHDNAKRLMEVRTLITFFSWTLFLITRFSINTIFFQEEPLLIWLKSRGGTLFLFGPPGDAQYFKWGEWNIIYFYLLKYFNWLTFSELFFLAFSILLISPFLCFFTIDAMHNIAKATSVSVLSFAFFTFPLLIIIRKSL